MGMEYEVVIGQILLVAVGMPFNKSVGVIPEKLGIGKIDMCVMYDSVLIRDRNHSPGMTSPPLKLGIGNETVAGIGRDPDGPTHGGEEEDHIITIPYPPIEGLNAGLGFASHLVCNITGNKFEYCSDLVVHCRIILCDLLCKIFDGRKIDEGTFIGPVIHHILVVIILCLEGKWDIIDRSRVPGGEIIPLVGLGDHIIGECERNILATIQSAIDVHPWPGVFLGVSQTVGTPVPGLELLDHRSICRGEISWYGNTKRVPDGTIVGLDVDPPLQLEASGICDFVVSRIDKVPEGVQIFPDLRGIVGILLGTLTIWSCLWKNQKENDGHNKRILEEWSGIPGRSERSGAPQATPKVGIFSLLGGESTATWTLNIGMIDPIAAMGAATHCYHLIYEV